MTITPDKRPAARRGDEAAALRGVGLRLTRPRRLVLEVVRGSDAHPTAEAVHDMVRCRMPRVSLGTVYRNLRLLVAQGLVKELPGPHTRFDCNLSEHHHFTCLACGRIADVAGPLTERHARALVSRVASSGGFSVTHHRIEFYGRCAACRKKGRGKTAPSAAGNQGTRRQERARDRRAMTTTRRPSRASRRPMAGVASSRSLPR